MMSVPLRRWPPSSRGNCVIDRISRWASSLSSPAALPTVHSSSPHQQPTQPCISSRLRTSLYHHQCIPRSVYRPTTTLVLLSRNPARIATPTPTTTKLTTTTTRTMSSDDAYMSFLNKANADLDTARNNQQTSSSGGAARTETIHTGVSIPGPLTSVDAFYISETDEPFEPVALKWDGAHRGVWPDASNFSSLISETDDLASAIETLSPASFDPKNQYASALRAVRAAAASQASGVEEADVDVKVYRVEVGSARVEYYVVALQAEGGLLVGLRAKAIES